MASRRGYGVITTIYKGGELTPLALVRGVEKVEVRGILMQEAINGDGLPALFEVPGQNLDGGGAEWVIVDPDGQRGVNSCLPAIVRLDGSGQVTGVFNPESDFAHNPTGAGVWIEAEVAAGEEEEGGKEVGQAETAVEQLGLNSKREYTVEKVLIGREGTADLPSPLAGGRFAGGLPVEF